MYSRVAILCAAAAFLAVSAAPADDKPDQKPTPAKPRATLKLGADLPGPFRPYNVVNGKFAEKFHCLTNEHGLNPGVMIFAQNVDTTKIGKTRQLLQELDDYIVDKPKTRLSAFAVFTFPDLADVVKDDDVREVRAGEVKRVAGGEKALQQVVLCLDSDQALQKAGYPLEKPITVVLYDKLKVAGKKIYTFESDDAVYVKGIMDDVKTNLAPFKK